MSEPIHSRGPQAERTIAAARAVLACASLFAIWLDPSEPAQFAALTYTLHSAYVTYALVLALFVWRRRVPSRLPLVTHVADIAVFSFFQYLTRGPSSPFFIYFVFSVFCGALRWGWRGALSTAAVVLVAFLGMGVAMGRTLGTDFELNRFIIRTVYLGMVAWLLVYLGQHESRLRDEIGRLARWPATTAREPTAAIAQLLEHAALIVSAPSVTLVWEGGDEPWVYAASWSGGAATVTRHAPTAFDPLVDPARAGGAFVVPSSDTPIVDAAFRSRLPPGAMASAAFETDRVAGRAFFCGLREPTDDLLALVEVVVRELGASMSELVAQTHVQQLAIREERIRVARDLHDGVLQSMTGIRFELQAIAQEQDTATPALRDRLLALERALAREQRELRLFIDDLKPLSQPALAGGTLAEHVEQLRRRLADEWKLPIALRVGRLDRPLPKAIEGAVPLMVQEAVVNALKHASPSKVTIDVGLVNDTLAITVCDDGRGFSFRGRYDHAMLEQQNVGPLSLRERVATLGGRLTIDSAPTGSRVEIELPVRVQETEWRSA